VKNLSVQLATNPVVGGGRSGRHRRSRGFLFLLLLIHFTSFVGAREVECQKGFALVAQTLGPHRGESVTKTLFAVDAEGKQIAVTSAEDEVRFLGGGEYGGNVYSVHPKEGKPFVLKIYDDRHDVSAVTKAESDAAALSLLNQACGGEYCGIAPVKVLEQIGVNAHKIDLVEGRDLNKLIDALSPEEFRELHDRFLKELKELSRRLRQQSRISINGRSARVEFLSLNVREGIMTQPLPFLRAHAVYSAPDGSQKTIDLFIKGDNVIYENGIFRIIDPF
jgi:predicted DNA-binding antitoxin AbrB/MazE fold protein